MTFWDSSALVPLLVEEPASIAARDMLARDRDVIIWMMTGVELLSALGRLGREVRDLEDVLGPLRTEVVDLVRRCARVTDADAVRRRAERLVSVHALSAADALQLGAALVVAANQPEHLPFVTLDKALARAARVEGFPVIPAVFPWGPVG